MQYFIYVYNEADRRILNDIGLPMLHDKSAPWCRGTPHVFLVNGIADKADTDRLMARLSNTAVLSNRLFFAGMIPHPAGWTANIQEV